MGCLLSVLPMTNSVGLCELHGKTFGLNYFLALVALRTHVTCIMLYHALGAYSKSDYLVILNFGGYA